MNHSAEPLTAEFQAVKSRQKATWEAGDFARIARYNEPSAEEFMARLPIPAGCRLLDVACGSGNLATIAARNGCQTFGLDLASNLISQARARAAADGLEIDYREGDAEALPYENASFDVVVSMYGVMFAPRPELAAAELLRVTRPGGLIALANWTPEGFIGKMFEVFKKYIPPLPGLPSPLQWGSEETAQARLRPGVREFRFSRQIARLRYPFDPPGTVEFFRKYYGPTERAFASLDEQRQAALRSALEELQAGHNVSDDPRVTETPAEYLQVIAVRNGMH